MGGASDLPQRSSSPLKRRAEELEELAASQTEDVDMGSPTLRTAAVLPDRGRVKMEGNQPGKSSSLKNSSEPPDGEEDPSDGQSDSEEGPRASIEELPPIDEQIAVVTKMCEDFGRQNEVAGTKAYIISMKWLARVQSRGSAAKVSDKEDLEGEIGPIDNTDIIQEILKDQNGNRFARLKAGVMHSIQYFPEEAWNYVMKWYGLKAGQEPIVRKLLNTNPDPVGMPNFQYELYPPIFFVHRLWAAHSPIPLPQIMKASQPVAPVFIMSRSDGYMDFLKKIKTAASIDLSQLVRLWRVPRDLSNVESIASSIANELSPPISRSGTPGPHSVTNPQDSWTHLLLDVKTFLELEKGVQRELVDQNIAKDQTNNPNYNGHSSIDMVGLGADQSLVLDELAEGNVYLSQYVPSHKGLVNSTRAGNSLTTPKPATDSGRSSPAPSGPITRGRSQKSGKTVGMVGLSNLGNTCYMNSALQCVRNVEELTKYFLAHEAAKEINVDNPLGNHGDVANAYSHLLEEIYRDPPPTSVAPRQFKNTIGRYAPSFSGYGQQDSQEFLGFLLDGLQEDLSRVKKKPYIEKPDSTDEMVGNPDAIREMAAKVWDITKKRDDSVIADLFTGMYKSTLVCPVCDKVSITFDPFNNLTLQLPIENTWSHDVFFFPLNDAPIRISIDLDKQASIKGMKEFISRRVGVPENQLFVAEEWKNRFFKYFDDMKPASEEIGNNDQIAVYELESAPTNWPPRKKPAKKPKSMLHVHNFDADDDELPPWDDPIAERMIVPILQRQPNLNDNNRFRSKPWVHAPVPHFIILTPEEARNEDAIRRKILEKIATFTTYPLFHEDYDNDDISDAADPDLVVTTSSDADSSGDVKVVATSVDGEDDVVDVTMNDPHMIRESVETDESITQANGAEPEPVPRKRKSRTQRPKWIDPKEFLKPEFQNMFDLSYFSSGGKELVPIGWNSVDEDKEYPRLSTRAPKIPSDDQDQEDYNRTASFEDESSDDDLDREPKTRMLEESSDEDELAPNYVPKVLPVRPIPHGSSVRVGFTKRPKIRTYSTKGNKSAMQSHESNTDDAVDNGPLVRLGEGIVVDWKAEAHDILFEGEPEDEMRGMATYTQIDMMPDPELDAKRKLRNSRRKKGLTLEECLDEFGKEEILSEMDTWYCPRCKEHRRASKKFELWRTPDILVMHLKRFSSGAMRRDKLDVLVEFPIDGLDLTERVVEREAGKEEIYDLFAVDDHWGGLGGGHYTAFAKSFIDGEWYEYNDSSVTKQRDTSRIVSSGAYLLFYRRRSDVPLGGPRFKEIIDRIDNPPEPSEDEFSGSGEDQRLVEDSSLRGSTSALVGVGAAHQVEVGSGGVLMTRNPLLLSGPQGIPGTVNPASLDRPPPYQELDDDDGAPLITHDAVMRDTIHLDEGIDLSEIAQLSYNNYNARHSLLTPMQPNWSFDNLINNQMIVSGTGSDADLGDGSNSVQHDSSASHGSLAGRLEDLDHDEAEGPEWEDPSPVPDVDDLQMDLYDMHGDIRAQLSRNLGDAFGQGMEMEMKVPAAMEGSVEEGEDEAAEIHVEEGEGLKLD